jgi:glyoxylase I family protein
LAVPGFHHLAIRCGDLGGCERFYREVLGLAVLRRWPAPQGGDRSVWLAVGDGFLALERAGGPAAEPGSERDPEGNRVGLSHWPDEAPEGA